MAEEIVKLSRVQKNKIVGCRKIEVIIKNQSWIETKISHDQEETNGDAEKIDFIDLMGEYS